MIEDLLCTCIIEYTNIYISTSKTAWCYLKTREDFWRYNTYMIQFTLYYSDLIYFKLSKNNSHKMKEVIS